MSRHFDVIVTKEDGWWVAQTQGVTGGATEARKLKDLRGEVIDLLSGLLDLDEADIELTMQMGEAVPAAAEQINTFRDAQQALDDAKATYEQAQREAAVQLREQGVSVRDAAELLGLSFQRVSQLTQARAS